MAAEVEFASVPISVTVNGVKHDAAVEPRELLVYFLREHLALTGTHVGCDTQAAPARSLNGRAVRSCGSRGRCTDGAEVTTIEASPAAKASHGQGRFAAAARNAATARRG